MSTSLSIKAYSSKQSKEYQKHYKAVQFCVENELSYPKETSEFFKGKIGGFDLEDYSIDYILEKIENGVEVPLIGMTGDSWNGIKIKVSDIPAGVDEIIVSFC